MQTAHFSSESEFSAQADNGTRLVGGDHENGNTKPREATRPNERDGRPLLAMIARAASRPESSTLRAARAGRARARLNSRVVHTDWALYLANRVQLPGLQFVFFAANDRRPISLRGAETRARGQLLEGGRRLEPNRPVGRATGTGHSANRLHYKLELCPRRALANGPGASGSSGELFARAASSSELSLGTQQLIAAPVSEDSLNGQNPAGASFV